MLKSNKVRLVLAIISVISFTASMLVTQELAPLFRDITLVSYSKYTVEQVTNGYIASISILALSVVTMWILIIEDSYSN